MKNGKKRICGKDVADPLIADECLNPFHESCRGYSYG
jgi:hypothetical protein